MQRSCDVCGKVYEARRVTSKYCGSACRTRVSRANAAAGSAADPGAAVPATRDVEGVDVVAAVRLRLQAAGRVADVAGQQALLLAHRLMTATVDTGSSLASVSKELRAVMAEALEGAAASDPIDELRARREAKRSG